MVHCNNCTNDINAWVGCFLARPLELFGAEVSAGELYTKLCIRRASRATPTAAACWSTTTWPARASPIWTRAVRWWSARPDSKFTLANFMRSQLYAAMATTEASAWIS